MRMRRADAIGNEILENNIRQQKMRAEHLRVLERDERRKE